MTTGEATATLAHLGGIAGWEIHDEIMGAGDGGGFNDLFAAGIGIGERDVFFHRPIKQHRFLRHDADLTSQRIQLDFADVNRIHQNRSPFGLIEAR